MSENLLIKNIFTYFPPKICIPSNEQMSINSESSNRRPAIDLILFNSDATKLLSELQYLNQKEKQRVTHVMPYNTR